MAVLSLSPDAVLELRRRLSTLPARCQVVQEAAATYGVSIATVYRALHAHTYPKAVHRQDRGTPRVLPVAQLERYCELIAAMKLRTTNKKGRHLSTAEAIRLLEVSGVETPDGFVRVPPGLHPS
jgi:transposase